MLTGCPQCKARRPAAPPIDLAIPPCPASVPPAPVPRPGTPLSDPCPSLTPSLQDLLGAPIPTARHIPSACRLQFATILGGILQSLAANPTWEAAHQLVALPKLTLCR